MNNVDIDNFSVNEVVSVNIGDPIMATKTKSARALIIGLRAAWILITTGSASAETLEEKQACIADAFQFCSSAIPNRDRVFNCLVANEDVISAACHAVIVPNVPADQASSQKLLRHNERSKKRPLNMSSYLRRLSCSS